MNTQLPTRLQDLNPKAAHFCLGIENFITNKLTVSLKNTTFLVALSGGVDSSALLIVLSCLAEKNNSTVKAAHFNHKLRLEADDEEQHVQALCKLLDIELLIESYNVAEYAEHNKIGIEEAARHLRYAFLAKAKAAANADFIVTGHHANDLAEDVIMRLVRGTGWPALGGMEGVCFNRSIVRPLLSTSKNDIQKFAKSIALSWCEDASNEDTTFLRNRVRSEIIPLLCKENPAFLTAITSLWDLARIDDNHWKSIIDTHLENTDHDQPILHKQDLKSMSQATRLRIYKAILTSMGEGQPLQANLLALDAAWKANIGGKIVQFPGNKTATISKGSIYFKFQ